MCAQSVTLTFTGSTVNNLYVPLNRVVVSNLTTGYYNVSAIIRNISYAKEVKAVWSEDNFKTTKTVNLNYKEFVNGHSYGSTIERKRPRNNPPFTKCASPSPLPAPIS